MSTEAQVQKVKIAASKNAATLGQIVLSTSNPEIGRVRVISETKTWSNGMYWSNSRTGFLRARMIDLKAWMTNDKWKDGSELPGHVAIQDTLLPLMTDKVTGEASNFGLRIPQTVQGQGYNAIHGAAIRAAALEQGVSYTGSVGARMLFLQGLESAGTLTGSQKKEMEYLNGFGADEFLPIYRKMFYSPFQVNDVDPAIGKSCYEGDDFIAVTNSADVIAFVQGLNLKSNNAPVGNAGTVNFQDAMKAELKTLKSIAMSKRTDEQKERIEELTNELA